MTRTFTLRDYWTVKHYEQRGVGFDLRHSLLHPGSPSQLAVVGHLTRYHLGMMTLVKPDRAPGGFVQVWPQSDSQSWHLSYLAPSLDEHAEACGVWRILLRALLKNAASQGVLRVFARSTEDAEIEGVLRQFGFGLVTREEVFVLTSLPAPVTTPRGLRPLSDRDRWDLQRLYHRAVPSLVQKAQGLDDRVAYAPVIASADEHYVWVDRGEMVAYLGVSHGRTGSWVDIVVRPERRADALPYIHHVLSRQTCSRDQPLYVGVPDYAMGLGWLLRTLGFETFARQAVLVAHTTARVHVERPAIVPGLEGADYSAPVATISPRCRLN